MKKIAIVTGSRRGIGLATVKKLMSDGYTAVLCDVVEKEEVKDLLAAFTVRHLCQHGEGHVNTQRRVYLVLPVGIAEKLSD